MSIIWEHKKTLVQVLRLQIISDTNNQTPTWVLGLYYLIVSMILNLSAKD